jgi:hypothetical protein
MQLKTMVQPSIALSFGTALYRDMERAASTVKGYSDVTVGTLTPAARFTAISTVPESTRYTVSKAILEHQAGASKTQLEANAQAKASQARKRARLE